MFCYEYIVELRRHRRNPESSDMLRRTDSESRVSDSCLHIITLVCLIILYNFISIGPLWFCFSATCFLFWRKSFLSFVYKWIYERSYILTSEKGMKTRLIIPVINNLGCCEIKSWKKFKPMTSVIPVQYSTYWAIKPSGSWSLCVFVIYL